MATQQPALRRSSVWNYLGTLIVWKLCPGKTAKSWFFYDCLDFTSDWYLATAKTIFYSMGRYTITLNWGEQLSISKPTRQVNTHNIFIIFKKNITTISSTMALWSLCWSLWSELRANSMKLNFFSQDKNQKEKKPKFPWKRISSSNDKPTLREIFSDSTKYSVSFSRIRKSWKHTISHWRTSDIAIWEDYTSFYESMGFFSSFSKITTNLVFIYKLCKQDKLKFQIFVIHTSMIKIC